MTAADINAGRIPFNPSFSALMLQALCDLFLSVVFYVVIAP
jgi:hypothetical protein